jgi:hypothetical protein
MVPHYGGNAEETIVQLHFAQVRTYISTYVKYGMAISAPFLEKYLATAERIPLRLRDLSAGRRL